MKYTQTNSLKNPVNVVVVGSINCDLTTYVSDFPIRNQTIMANNSVLSVGGKGVNQAVAAAKDGAKVSIVGCVGDDVFADKAVNYLRLHKINTLYVRRIQGIPTGTASIMVTEKQENLIAVSPGANWQLTVEDVGNVEELISKADVVIVQLEVPPETVRATLALCRKHDVLSVLNPAPAANYAKSMYSLADIVTPNETEASVLTGIDVSGLEGVSEAANVMLSQGVNQVIVTLGERGSFIASDDIKKFLPSYSVDVIDPTGAGDVFNGVLAVSIAAGLPLIDAVIRSSAAAALSVTKPQAQNSAPDTNQIDRFIQLNSIKPE